jgi:hypothetical protein
MGYLRNASDFHRETAFFASNDLCTCFGTGCFFRHEPIVASNVGLFGNGAALSFMIAYGAHANL